jgi:hypothetical protein
LLVTVTIVLILVGLALGGLYGAQEQARKVKTQTTINKIDRVIRDLWSEVPTRRIPTDQASRQLGRRKYLDNCRRDLMRLEMPDRWNEVTGDPACLPLASDRGGAILYARQETWRRAYTQAVLRAGQAAVGSHESSECLYLVATVGRPEARAQFAEHEVGDIDRDGLKEFHDAWGNPIRWCRWPAGWTLRVADEREEPSTDRGQDGIGPYPLIFSAGPDGIYDVTQGVEYDPVSGDPLTYRYGLDVSGNLNPWQYDQDNPPRRVGEPVDAADLRGNSPNGHLDHYDNITN